MSTSPRIYVAGHRGMVGSAIVRQLQVMDCHVADAPRNDELTVIASEARQSMPPATIAKLAQAVSETIGYSGQITFDPAQPDGAPRKLMDSGRLNALGWQAKVNLEQGLALAYQDFLNLWSRLQPAVQHV